MNTNHYHQLIDRGRKAGLTARELNSALSSYPVRGTEQPSGQGDANGYLSSIGTRGQRISRPLPLQSNN